MRIDAQTLLTLLAVALSLTATASNAQDTGSLNGFSIAPEFGGAQSPPPGGSRRLDDIVAVVGDDVILKSELDDAENGLRARAGKQIDRVPRNVLRSQVLDRLIVAKLQVQRAKKRNIQISDRQLNAGLARIARQNNMSMDQFRRAVARDGSTSMSQLRDRVRRELMITNLRRKEVMSKVSITDDDVDRYLENKSLRGQDSDSARRVMVDEVKLRHILLKPNEIRNDARTRKLADQIRARLTAGDDFASLARQYSDDNTSANQGGELGWVRPASLSPATRRRLAGLSGGQISQVFRSRNGYQLIELQDRRRRDRTRQAIRRKARRALGEQKSEEQGQLWLRKLRDEAYVDIRMPDYQPTRGG